MDDTPQVLKRKEQTRAREQGPHYGHIRLASAGSSGVLWLRCNDGRSRSRPSGGFEVGKGDIKSEWGGFVFICVRFRSVSRRTIIVMKRLKNLREDVSL